MNTPTAYASLGKIKNSLDSGKMKWLLERLKSAWQDNRAFLENLAMKARLFFLRRRLAKDPAHGPTGQAVEDLEARISGFRLTMDQKKSVLGVWGAGAVAAAAMLFLFTGPAKSRLSPGESLAMAGIRQESAKGNLETPPPPAPRPGNTEVVASTGTAARTAVKPREIPVDVPQPADVPKAFGSQVTLGRNPKEGWGEKQLAEMKEVVCNYVDVIPDFVEDQTGTISVESGIPGRRSNGHSIKQSSQAEEENHQKVIARILWRTGPLATRSPGATPGNYQVTNLRVSRSGNEALVHVVVLSEEEWSPGEWVPVTVALEDGRRLKVRAGVGLEWKQEPAKSYRERMARVQNLDRHEVEVTFPLIDYPLIREITVNPRR
jgi:hypothetical protein